MRVEGLGFRVQGLVLGVGCLGLALRVERLRVRVLGYRVQGLGVGGSEGRLYSRSYVRMQCRMIGDEDG